MLEAKKRYPLDGLKIIVIGAGPGGLNFAKGAQAQGADVSVLERAGDPRHGDPGYTDRSFNLTLNNVGRAALGDPRAWQGGIDIIGRAIHGRFPAKVMQYASYGEGDPARLTSLPRPVLRQRLVELAEEQGVELLFRVQVVDIEPDTGMVLVEYEGGTQGVRSADLIVVADGVHSISDKIIEALPGGSLNRRLEPYSYVTVALDKKVCERLSLHHIHFWHAREKDSFAVGVPNGDGTIAVLMISHFDDVDPDSSPFPTIEEATARLKVHFPQLLALDPKLGETLLGRRRGHFYYKSINKYVLGKRCVVVGDAGTATPPWAAFGANTALYSADAFVRFLVGHKGDVEKAAYEYEHHQLVLADLVSGFVLKHGNFLSQRVESHPEEESSSPVLGWLVNEAVRTSGVVPGVSLLTFPDLTIADTVAH